MEISELESSFNISWQIHMNFYVFFFFLRVLTRQRWIEIEAEKEIEV